MKSKFHLFIDGFLFFAAIAIGLMFAIQGKAISSHLFNGREHWFREYKILPHIISIVCAFIYQYIRSKQMPLRYSMLVAPVIGISSIFAIHLTSTSPSILVFSIQLLLIISACAVIALEPYLKKDIFETEFWKIFLESSMKVVRYIIMLYLGGFAL